MMAPMLHSSLESFLLLQSLHPFDQEPLVPSSFERISDSLKRNDLLRQTGSIDTKRLDPDSLQDLYVRLLKEEARTEATGHVGSPTKATNPRKRKLSSPPLDTIDDASQYAYLLPKLVSRLYYKYRDEAIKAIEEEESRYLSLQKEIEGLQRDEEDARPSMLESQGVPPISELLRETEDSALPRRPSSPGMPAVNGPTHGPAPGETPGPYHKPRNIHADIYSPYPVTYNPFSQSGSTENCSPNLSQPTHHGQGYRTTSPRMDGRSSSQSRASPRLNQALPPPPERSSASPIILPPPKGMIHPCGSPPGPLNTIPDMAGQQYHRQNTTIPSPQQAQYCPPRQQTPSRHPPQQQYSAYYDVPGYTGTYSPYNQNPVPIYHPHAGNMQSYHAPSQNPGHGSVYGVPPYQTAVPSQHPVYYPRQGAYPPPVQTPYGQQAAPYFESRTPVSGSSRRQLTMKLTPISTSTSSTKWKNVGTPAIVRSPRSPARPLSREISPISDKEASPDAGEATIIKRGNSAPGIKQGQEQEKDPETSVIDTKGSKLGGTHRRGTVNPSREGRGGSVASSTVPDSTRRSHSVIDDHMVDQTYTTNRIKPEDDSTSVVSPTAENSTPKSTRRRRDPLGSLDVNPRDANSKRKSEKNAPSSASVRKSRQLATSPVPTATTPQRSATAERSGYVLAARNFPRVTLPLLNEISSHRLASLFAKPLTDRDAPGYRDLIYRPQDLKSIRTAINAGSKALSIAMDELDEPAGMGPHVWVPENEELIPPKGIVNAGQLEKELMRIFANAVMFNPDVAENRGLGPAFRTRQRLREANSLDETASAEPAEAEAADGTRVEIGVAAPVEGAVVKDTREVAKNAQESFARWRAVERHAEEVANTGTPGKSRGGDTEAEEVADGAVKESVEQREEEGEEEEGGGRRSKRRRK
ncbi:MAG: hypothetical protein Q9163_005177 [Psora crenata]